jgi:hypothetical protein
MPARALHLGLPLTLPLVLLLAAGLPGCALECTDEEVYGVELQITEEGGVRDAPLEVRYRVDGGEWRTDAVCFDRSVCWLGSELDGDYEIEVTRGAAFVAVQTRVQADRCHVITQVVPVTIPDV